MTQQRAEAPHDLPVARHGGRRDVDRGVVVELSIEEAFTGDP